MARCGAFISFNNKPPRTRTGWCAACPRAAERSVAGPDLIISSCRVKCAADLPRPTRQAAGDYPPAARLVDSYMAAASTQITRFQSNTSHRRLQDGSIDRSIEGSPPQLTLLNPSSNQTRGPSECGSDGRAAGGSRRDDRKGRVRGSCGSTKNEPRRPTGLPGALSSPAVGPGPGHWCLKRQPREVRAPASEMDHHRPGGLPPQLIDPLHP